MFTDEEVLAAHGHWVNMLKAVMPDCSELQLKTMAMDRAIAELKDSRAETLAAIQEGARMQIAAATPVAPPAPATPVCDINSLATYLPAKERKAMLA
jgi:hypothetical protein